MVAAAGPRHPRPPVAVAVLSEHYPERRVIILHPHYFKVSFMPLPVFQSKLVLAVSVRADIDSLCRRPPLECSGGDGEPIKLSLCEEVTVNCFLLHLLQGEGWGVRERERESVSACSQFVSLCHFMSQLCDGCTMKNDSHRAQCGIPQKAPITPRSFLLGQMDRQTAFLLLCESQNKSTT